MDPTKVENEITYWRDRCLAAERKLEFISSIPKMELRSLASTRQVEIDELKYKACKLLKKHDIDKWDKICENAKMSDDKIYFWTIKVQEGLILQEYLASIK